MPLYIACTSAEPGRPFSTEPTVGTSLATPEEPPRVNTMPRTTATATSTTIPAAIPSTFGLACRCLGAPFDRTGGGAAATAAAWRRICLLFFPLGIGGKGCDGF